MAKTWLNQECWKDNIAPLPADVTQIGFHADFGSAELDAWDAYGRATKGINYPRDKLGGWTFPTQWPPEAASLGPKVENDETENHQPVTQIHRISYE